MNSDHSQSDTIQVLLERLANGDESARDELIAAAGERLMNLTRSMKRTYDRVNRWEQTDDVFQRSIMRLHRALTEVDIADVRHFYRLAATQIRRELIDLTRHYGGPQGMGANHATQMADNPDRSEAAVHGAYDAMDEDGGAPQELSAWTELHRAIEQLPEEQKEVVELLFYNGLSQTQASELLGVSTRTVKRYWRNAKLSLFEELGGEFPGLS
jgi:RNA polymerase sigma-70 factor (ECF subfamily)